MKYRIILIGVIIVVFFSISVVVLKKVATPIPTNSTIRQESLEEDIVHALAKKNNWKASDVAVHTLIRDDNFAKGEVKLNTNKGGGLWFAAQVKGAWHLVYDGNGIIPCANLIAYPTFPKKIIPTCYDDTTDSVVTR